MEFPKKYKPKEVEEKWREYWKEENIYRFTPDSGKPVFSIDTPPAYISAEQLHVGHAMSYSQAEFIVRYKRMRGFNIFYPMGFDDNGLPTERFVESKYKINKSDIKRDEFIKLCLRETKIGGEKYKEHWQALGISVDWSMTYSTIDPRCRKTSQLSFKELYDKGLIERRNDLVQWCGTCQTALAQAEINVEETDSKLYDVRFNSEDGDELIISTTRPTLIPACVALYAHPDDARYKHLRNKKARVPLFDYTVPIKFDQSVDPEFGTGLMMVCTFGDVDDCIKWKQDKLDTRIIIDDRGVLNDLAGPYAGLHLTRAHKKIVEDLSRQDLIIGSADTKHNVGVHERCSNPVEFNIKPQWFIRILDFKDKFLARGDQLQWRPDFSKARYTEWVSNLKWDWNISRQRYYGVPFPVWYCKSCSHPIIAEEENLPVDPLIDGPQTDKCPKCGTGEFIPETDVMDTWMTSSVTPLIVANWAYQDSLQEKVYPMSLRPQAFEIIRTWLFYTVVKSDFHTDSLPWETVMISGWGLDKHGKKMSKRTGNFVALEKVVTRYSADALRYWAAKGTLGHDLRYNEEDVVNGKRLQIKLWNAARFLAQNIGETPHEENVPLQTTDKWLISKLQAAISQATDFFDKYEYSHALRVTEKLFWNDYCDDYLEIIKDRLWNPDNYGDDAVASARAAMYRVFLEILKLFAPFLPYITEEIYSIIYKQRVGEKSIHITRWPEADSSLMDEESELKTELLISILRGVRKRKTEMKIHQNHWISELAIESPDSVEKEILKIESDLKSAARAEKITFGKSARFETENPDIKIELL